MCPFRMGDCLRARCVAIIWCPAVAQQSAWEKLDVHAVSHCDGVPKPEADPAQQATTFFVVQYDKTLVLVQLVATCHRNLKVMDSNLGSEK